MFDSFSRHGITDMQMLVEHSRINAAMESLEPDCHASPEDGCSHCEQIQNDLENQAVNVGNDAPIITGLQKASTNVLTDKQLGCIMRLLGRNLWSNNLDIEVPLRENVDKHTASYLIDWMKNGNIEDAKKQLRHLGVPVDNE